MGKALEKTTLFSWATIGPFCLALFPQWPLPPAQSLIECPRAAGTSWQHPPPPSFPESLSLTVNEQACLHVLYYHHIPLSHISLSQYKLYRNW